MNCSTSATGVTTAGAGLPLEHAPVALDRNLDAQCLEPVRELRRRDHAADEVLAELHARRDLEREYRPEDDQQQDGEHEREDHRFPAAEELLELQATAKQPEAGDAGPETGRCYGGH